MDKIGLEKVWGEMDLGHCMYVMVSGNGCLWSESDYDVFHCSVV